MSKTEQTTRPCEAGFLFNSIWHVSCLLAVAMKTGSLSKPGCAALLLSILLLLGIASALLLPPPHLLQSPSREQNLFTLVEGDHFNPLFSSASKIRLLNNAVRDLALFAGYDQFHMRVDLPSGLSVATVTRYSGDLLSMLNVKFESRLRQTSAHPSIYISDSFWERAFARNPHIIGTVLKVNQAAYHIAGITRSHRGLLDATDIWIPMQSRGNLCESNSMKILGFLYDNSNWKTAQRQVKNAFKQHHLESACAETESATLLPISSDIQIREFNPMVAARMPESALARHINPGT